MFEIVKTGLKDNTSMMVVTYKGNSIAFNIKTGMINKNDTGSELNHPRQFELLNKYLDYRGEKFKSELYNKLLYAYDRINNYYINVPFYTLPIPCAADCIYPILDMFNIEEIYQWLNNNPKIFTPPSNFKEVFDKNEISNYKNNEEITYTRPDYMYLVALGLVVKASIGPICEFGNTLVQNESVSGNNSKHKEYKLFWIYRDYEPFMSSRPIERLLIYINYIINSNHYRTPTSGDNKSVKTIEIFMSVEELPYVMLSMFIFLRLASYPMVDDNNDRHAITKIYSYIKQRLDTTTQPDKSIKNKTSLVDADSTTGEKDSCLERYRILTAHPLGTPVELEHFTSDIFYLRDILAGETGVYIENDELISVRARCMIYTDHFVSEPQKTLILIAMKSILHPNDLEYINMSGLISLISLTFCYMQKLGFLHLGVIFTARQLLKDEDDDGLKILNINKTTFRSSISQEINDELDIYFPNKKLVTGNKIVNVISDVVSTLNSTMLKMNLKPIMDREYLDIIDNSRGVELIPPDFKVMLCKFIIENEKRIENKRI